MNAPRFVIDRSRVRIPSLARLTLSELQNIARASSKLCVPFLRRVIEESSLAAPPNDLRPAAAAVGCGRVLGRRSVLLS